MLGTIVNTAAVLLGGGLGLLLRAGIKENIKRAVMSGLGLCVILIGMSGALKTNDITCVIVCMALGGLIGALLRIEDRINTLGDFMQRKFARGGNGISQGFITATLLFCVGSMAVVGAMESGISGNHQTLFAKSILDGVSALIFSSALGAGVLLSAIPLFLYQGFITLCAGFIAPILSADMLNEMSAVGSLLIVGIGINMLHKKILNVADLLPAVFLPVLYIFIKAYF